MTFATLGLSPQALRAVSDQGYSHPTPVQAQAIPLILEGRDLLAGAQTGTGKTAAFVLPMLERLHAARPSGPRAVRALVVVPTRELALQVEQSVRTYGAYRPSRSTAIYGGVNMDRQVRALRGGIDIVVATPGRLLDHVRQRTVDLSRVEMLVLDEADRMLDMGFIHDIKRILALLPTDRQSLLFSATFSPSMRRFAEDLLRDPASVDAAPRNTAAAPIHQVVHPVDRAQKRDLLSHLVRSRNVEQVLVFTRTKRGATRLAEQLEKDGIRATAIHGNKSQSQRVRALTAFKQGHSQVLVATDIAARGLDIESLPHVVNYELPVVAEDYVHRIGRTGRAGQEGRATSLLSEDEHALMQGIEKLLRKPIQREIVVGFEPSAVFRPEPIVSTQPRHGRGRQDGAAPRSSSGRATDGWVGRRTAGNGSVAGAGEHARDRRQAGREHLGAAGHVPAHVPALGHALPGERLSGKPSAARRSAGRGDQGNRSIPTASIGRARRHR